MQSIFEKMYQVDRRIIYAILLLAMVIPMFFTLGLPITIDTYVEDAYKVVNELPAGSVIWVGCEYSASQIAEIKPMLQAFVRLALQKGHYIYIGSSFADGCTTAHNWLQEVFAETKAVNGENYIIFGYRPSFNSTMEAVRSNVVNAMSDRDHYGNKLSDKPIMKHFTKASDIDLVLVFDSGSPGSDDYIAVWRSQGEVNLMVCGATGVELPNQLVKYDAGLLQGVVGGMNGAAQLEKLVGVPGSATKGMDSQGLAHLTIIAFMIIGNIGYLVSKKQNSSKSNAKGA